jgi:hypothetical protein
MGNAISKINRAKWTCCPFMEYEGIQRKEKNAMVTEV